MAFQVSENFFENHAKPAVCFINIEADREGVGVF
jgi:hypothetical protein